MKDLSHFPAHIVTPILNFKLENFKMRMNHLLNYFAHIVD